MVRQAERLRELDPPLQDRPVKDAGLIGTQWVSQGKQRTCSLTVALQGLPAGPCERLRLGARATTIQRVGRYGGRGCCGNLVTGRVEDLGHLESQGSAVVEPSEVEERAGELELDRRPFLACPDVLEGTLEVPQGLARNAQRTGSARGPQQEADRATLQLGDVGRTGYGIHRSDVVLGHDRVHVRFRRSLEVLRHREVAGLAIVARQRGVGHLSDHRLDELELPDLRAEAVRLLAEDLLPKERVEDVVQLFEVGRKSGDVVSTERRSVEAGCVDDPALHRGELVEPRRHDRLQRGGRGEVLEVEGRDVGQDVLATTGQHQVSVDQRAHGFHGVQRNSLRPVDQ